jgi:Tol biopolymer transport system component
VLELGLLLNALLPHGVPARVPGALRYTIARAVRDALAPPFESVADFSAALSRHETGDRKTLLEGLYARSAAGQPVAAPPPFVERRRQRPPAAELRRQLRDADCERYLLLRERAAAADATRAQQDGQVSEPAAARSVVRHWHLLAISVAALVSAYTAGYAIVARRLPRAIQHTDAIKTTGTSNMWLASASSTPSTSASSVQLRDLRTVDRGLVRIMARREGPGFSPAFASTGTTLFFHSGRSADRRSALEAADLTGREPHVTTILDDGARNYHVQPSPNGDQLAFDSDRDGERGVYIANRDGTNVRRVSGGGYAAVPTWSPDGTRLAFVRAETGRPRVWNLWLLRFDTGETRRLTHFGYGQTWSASWFTGGDRICYTHEDRLYVHDLETGAIREFRSPIAGAQARTPAASPDGRHVIFQIARHGVWLLDLERGTTTRVLDDPTAEEFAWSPDGRRVAFHSRRDGQWGIWAMTPLAATSPAGTG